MIRIEINDQQIEAIIHEQKFILHSNEMPEISLASIQVFKQLGVHNTDSLNGLKASTKTLSNSIQKLKNAKDHETKYKIFGFVRSALFVSLVAASVLAVKFLITQSMALLLVGSALGVFTLLGTVATGFGAFALLFGISAYYASRVGIKLHGDDYAAPIWMTVIAPMLPIYEEFWSVANKEKFVDTQRTFLEAKFNAMNAFFENDVKTLLETLRSNINDVTTSLETMKNLPYRTPKGEAEIQENLEKFTLALGELTKAIHYFQQFLTSIV